MTAQGQLNDIFLGLTPSAARNYLKAVYRELLSTHYTRLVFPCIGRFTALEAAVEAGWDTDRIEASDINLFSCMLGHLASRGHIRELNVRFQGEQFEHLQDWLDTEHAVGAVLYVLKLSQWDPDKHFTRVMVEELQRDPETYIRQLSGKAQAMAEKNKGISFEGRDMLDHITEAASDPGAVIYCNPPFWSGGYEKMFKAVGTSILWDDPKVPYFEVKTHLDTLYETMMGAEALTLLYRYADNGSGIHPLLVGKSVFGNQSGGRDEFVCANRPHELEMVVQHRKDTEVAPMGAPMLPPDYEITEDSRAAIRPITRGQAFYYRDLWAHKLGTTRSEWYFAVLIDGYVMGVFGMMFNRVITGQNGEVFEVFGFNCPSDRYPRLNRLLMRVITCRDAAAYYQSLIPSALLEVDYFKTACIADVPDVKANRGILKRLWSKPRPDGRHHIMYGTGFHDVSYNGALRKWLEDLKRQQKATGRWLGYGQKADSEYSE
jgi:hypothetical protein